MSFQNPAAFYLLILLIPILYFMWKSKRKTNQVLLTLKNVPPGKYYHYSKMFLALGFISSLIVVAASPYSRLERTADYLFLVDISRSMQARKNCSIPSYLDRAKNIMREVITDIPEARYGIYVYERLTFPITQMTFDHVYLDTVIEHGIYDGLVFDRTSTQLGKAFSTLVSKKQRFPEIYSNLKNIILISDGNLTDDYRQILEQPVDYLQQAELSVISVGIGNLEPTPIPIKEDGKCVDKVIVKEGNLVTISLRTDTLQYIADSTQGQYFGEGEVADLVAYLRERTLEDTFVDSEISQRQRNDISWVFLLFSSLMLFGYMLLDSNLSISFKKPQK